MKSLRSTLRLILAILLVFPLPVAVIFGLLLALFLGLYRLAHQVVAFIVRPELDGLLPPLENLFAHDNVDKPAYNICVLLTLDGKVSLESMQAVFLKNVVLDRRSDDGKLNYPELQKYWTSFGSYKFWKSDSDFDVRKHVRELDYKFDDSNNGSIESFSKSDPSGTNEEYLQKVFTRLQVHPWRENQSPWEMLLIPDNKPEESAGKTSFILRIHHTLGDGYAIQKLLLKLFHVTTKDSDPRDKKRVKMSPWQQCKFAIATVPQLALEILDTLYQFSLDKHDWMGHTKDPACSYFTTWTEGIDMDLIKRIKSESGVSFNAVVITAVMNTFHRMVQDAGLKYPKVITAFFPVPMPNPPSGLRVHSSGCLVKFSLGSGSSAVGRLKEVERSLKGVGRLQARFYFKASKLFGMLPSIVLRRATVFGVTIGLTCIPGPQGALHLAGHNLDRVLSNFSTGPFDLEAGGGCTVTAFSCFGKVRIVITLTTITWPFPPEILQENFDRYVHEEMEKLKGFSDV